MAKKKLDKTKLVKEMARDRLGTPPSSRVIRDKRSREKYKQDWREEHGGRGDEEFRAAIGSVGLVALGQAALDA